MNRKVICIAGPTASGKTSFSIELAQQFGGEIINADSMQVYEDLHIVTARPDEDEAKRVRHHLFGHVDSSDRYNTGRWVTEALNLIDDVNTRGKPAFVVGGTGLYFHALTVGLAEIPDIHPDIRRAVEEQARSDLAGLYREAESVDPAAMSKISQNDSLRISRVVEVFRSTGRVLSDWHKDTKAPLSPSEWRGAILWPDRDELYRRIDQRFEDMMASGAINEVERLLSKRLSPDLPAMKALGVLEITQLLRGEIDSDEAARLASRDTRRFAKRQLTWFRKQPNSWLKVKSSSDKRHFAQKISEFIH